MNQQLECNPANQRTEVSDEQLRQKRPLEQFPTTRAFGQVDRIGWNRVRGFAKQTGGPARAAGETVLIVEDDSAIRRLMVRMLMALGYRTLEAADGPSALRLLFRTAGVDLMLTDMILPKGMNGAELAERVQARYPELAILSMSGYTREALSLRGIRQDSLPLLAKPFGRYELARAVSLALSEQNEQLRAS
jgi:CheY-like chemotaxis protein